MLKKYATLKISFGKQSALRQCVCVCSYSFWKHQWLTFSLVVVAEICQSTSQWYMKWTQMSESHPVFPLAMMMSSCCTIAPIFGTTYCLCHELHNHSGRNEAFSFEELSKVQLKFATYLNKNVTDCVVLKQECERRASLSLFADTCRADLNIFY